MGRDMKSAGLRGLRPKVPTASYRGVRSEGLDIEQPPTNDVGVSAVLGLSTPDSHIWRKAKPVSAFSPGGALEWRVAQLDNGRLIDGILSCLRNSILNYR